ncbi:MAG TPA: TolC family protein [Terriglobales bacterium]|nr:TolC family protein [Terriglobales bacterium]
MIRFQDKVFKSFLFMFSMVLLSLASAEEQEAPPVLTLDAAVQLALSHNRPLQIANLDVDKARWQVKDTKTKRLPVFQTYVFGSGMLTSPTFDFPRGVFGNVQSGSPVPSRNTKISLSQGATAYVVGQVSQPLSQLYKIHLGIRQQELAVDINNEKFRAQRQSTIHDVKQAYYAVLQSESSLQAEQASVKQYQELDRVVLQYISQEAVLKSESLDVKAKLAQEQYKVVQLQDTLQTQREQLNNLLGREIDTPFRTEPVPAESAEEIDLKLAHQSALSQRPEIRQAELTVKQAEYDRRTAKAQYIPDIGLALHYLSPFNVEILPKNVASAGIELNWEPWDWGRRKDDINQKKVVRDEAEYQLKETQSKVLIDVNNRFRKLGEARMLVTVTQAARAAATEKLREVTDKFEQKSLLLRDVLQQQAAVAASNADYQQALLSFWSAKADFEKSLGGD